MTTRLHRADPAPGFSTYSLRGAFPMGHVLNIDHFTMSRPTFPPHPHAGFSAVTFMLPRSEGAFRNRDSLGDQSRIAPGGLHWTRAAAGMMHEEVPETPGIAGEGLQMFVKLPAARELDAPAAYRLPAEAIPRVRVGAMEVGVLAGSFSGQSSPIPSDGTTLLHAVVSRGSGALAVPPGVEAFAMALHGDGSVDGAPLREHEATPLPSGREVALTSATSLELIIGFGPSLPGPVHFQGPFAMFDRARLADAVTRFRSGGMGDLR